MPPLAGRISPLVFALAGVFSTQAVGVAQAKLGCPDATGGSGARTLAGVAKPPGQTPPTPAVTANSLPYRPGDSLLSTGEASLSERLNGKLPCWLRLSGELRFRGEGYSNGGFNPDSDEGYGLTRMRLGLTIIPTPWLRFHVTTQDSRIFGDPRKIPPYQDTFDFNQAYVELGHTESPGFGLRVGRQELYFGNGRFIGNSWWQNVSRSFDGVHGSYERGAYRLDAFLVSVVIERTGVIAHHNQGNNLSGLYGTIKNRVLPNSQFEPYVFWHVQPGATLKNGKPGHLDQWTGGFRFLGAMPAGFDYRTEVALQRGELGPAAISAWTGHWVFGNTLRTAWKFRPFVEYNYASGDSNPKDLTHWGTFDPLYPSNHDKLGLADQFGWRNIRDIRFGVDTRPAKRWSANLSFYDYWLADSHDALYPARGPIIARDPTGQSGTHVGQEADFQVIYKPNPQVQVGSGISRLFAGSYLKATTKGKDYTYGYVFVDYVF